MKDIRAWLISFFIIVSIILTSLAVLASAEEKRYYSAKAATLYNPDTATFLYEKNADERLPMASTTKIMTALVVLESLSLEQTVNVNPLACGVEGSSIYLKPGDTLTVRDLLYSLLLRSANDAALALAYEVADSVEAFAELMNARAESIGLKDTSFRNPHGLDSDEHYTTAKDLALIAAEAMNNADFLEIVSTYKYSFPLGDSIRTVVNHNKLLKQYDGVIGVKTGYTKKCGRCLVGAARRNGITLITVTLDAPDDWRDHKSLFNFGFTTLKSTMISELVATDYNLNVIGGKRENVSVTIDNSSPLIGKNDDVFTAEISIDSFISAPVKKFETLGEIYIYKNGELYETRKLISNESVERTIDKSLLDLFK